MITNLKRHSLFMALITATLFTVFSSFTSFAKTEVPVFLLSGQSNMAGMQRPLVSDLSAEQKEPVDSVMIHLDAEGDRAKRGKWLTLGPGFGSSSATFGPELFFGKTLADSLKTKIALIKDAVSGAPLGTVNGGYMATNGTLFKRMMTHIDAAMKSFDTSKYIPRWAGFVWLQGETDAMNKAQADAYETNLTNLIKAIREKAEVEDLPVILPMIDVQPRWTHNAIVRGANVKLTQTLTNVDTMDTKGLPSDGIHYRAPGQIKIGTECALRWLNMDFQYGEIVPVAWQQLQSDKVAGSRHFETTSFINIFQLNGRKLPISSNSNTIVLNRTRGMVVVKPSISNGNSSGLKVMCVGQQ